MRILSPQKKITTLQRKKMMQVIRKLGKLTCNAFTQPREIPQLRERRIYGTQIWLTFRFFKNARKMKKNLIIIIVLEGFNNDKET